MSEKDQQMSEVERDLIDLTTSPLYHFRTEHNYLPVLGEGSLHAQILIIGEAPGRREAETGKPFCGASGRLLGELLKSVHLTREDIYITNIVKDRPPENRDPTPDEIAAYGPLLHRQIDIIRPRIIVTLGRYSMMYILQHFGLPSNSPISAVHGTTVIGQASYGPVAILRLYHPAAAIYNQRLTQTLFSDFSTITSL